MLAYCMAGFSVKGKVKASICAFFALQQSKNSIPAAAKVIIHGGQD